MQNFNTNVPAVNIKETDTSFGIELAAPGKNKEDFNIEIDHNVLTISSEEKQRKKKKAMKENTLAKSLVMLLSDVRLLCQKL